MWFHLFPVLIEEIRFNISSIRKWRKRFISEMCIIAQDRNINKLIKSIQMIDYDINSTKRQNKKTDFCCFWK